MSETNQLLIELARLVGAGIVGGLIASFATHRFTVSREQDSGRTNRKRELRTFVLLLKSDILSGKFPHHRNISRQQSFAVFYQEKQHELRAAAGNVETDLRGKRRAEFTRLVATATGFTDQQAITNGTQPVVAALDEIVRFLEQ